MVCFYINKQVKIIMELNSKTSTKILGTFLILSIVGMVYMNVAESGAFLLTGTIGAMSTTLIWSE